MREASNFRFRLRSLRRQSGAAAVFAAIALVAGISALLLALDVGRMYFAQRRLQQQANAVALDSARAVSLCDGSSNATLAGIRTVAQQSLVNNGGSASSMTDADAIRLGVQDKNGALNVFRDTAADDASAVLVTLRQPFPTSFMPLWRKDPAQTMVAHAAAAQGAIGELSVGSNLLTIDSTKSALLNPLLSSLLGGAVNLSVVSYQGLAAGQVTLRNLTAQLGAATPGSLLTTQLTVPQALRALAAVVQNGSGGVQSTAQSALNTLAAVADPTKKVKLAQVLSLETEIEDVTQDVPINTLDLLNALAEAANVGYPITVPLSVSIPGITALTAVLRIGQPPQIAIGRPGYKSNGVARTKASTAQVVLTLAVSVLDTGRLLGAGAAVVNLNLVVQAATANATLDRVSCAHYSVPQHQSRVAGLDSLANISIGSYNPATGAITAPPPLLNIPVVLSMTLPQPLTVSLGDVNPHMLDFLGPFVPDLQTIVADNIQSLGSAAGSALDGATASLSSGLASKVQLGGLVGTTLKLLGVTKLTALLLNLLSPAWTLLDTTIASLLNLLGVQLASADVTMRAVDVTQPYLFTLDAPP